jgi:hypothetical protein
VIKGKLAVKLAKTAPIPKVTKIIGNAQHNIVEIEVNSPKNGNNDSFILIIIYLFILTTL